MRAININPEKKDKVVKRLKLYSKVRGPIKRRGFETSKVNANGVPLEITKPVGSTSKKLVFIVHGGVFVMPLMDMYRKLALDCYKELDDVVVINIDYRVAPEHVYPAAHDDVLTAWNYITGDMGFKPKNIVIFADSAGGNLSLSLTAKLRDAGLEKPAALALMSPWIDLSASGASYKGNYDKDILFGRRKTKLDENELRTQLLKCGVFAYVAGHDNKDPHLSPVFAEYHNFVPTLICVGGHEMLLDDSLTLFKKLSDAGGEVETIIGKGMFHCYPLASDFSPTAKIDFHKILHFINKHLQKGSN